MSAWDLEAVLFPSALDLSSVLELLDSWSRI